MFVFFSGSRNFPAHGNQSCVCNDCIWKGCPLLSTYSHLSQTCPRLYQWWLVSVGWVQNDWIQHKEAYSFLSNVNLPPAKISVASNWTFKRKITFFPLSVKIMHVHRTNFNIQDSHKGQKRQWCPFWGPYTYQSVVLWPVHEIKNA